MKNQSTLWRRNTNSFPVVEQPTKGTFCTKNTTVSWTKMPMKQQWGDVFFSPRQCLPQGLIYPLSPIFLSGKRELKQRRRWRQRERQKRNRLGWQNNNSARASRLFLNISLPSLHDYDVNLPNFTFWQGREHKATTFFFFSWTSIQSLRIQLQKKIDNIWRIEWDGISAIKVEAARIHCLKSGVFVAAAAFVA